MFAAFIVLMILMFAVSSILVDELGGAIACALATATLFIVLLGISAGGNQIPQRDVLRDMIKECESNMPRNKHCKVVAVPVVTE